MNAAFSTKIQEVYIKALNSETEISKIDGWVKRLAQATANLEEAVKVNLPLTFQHELNVKCLSCGTK